MANSYVLLGCAILFEALWAILLRFSNGFSVVWASGAMVVAYVGSLVCLSGACRGLAVSLAYTLWTGLGGTLVVLISTLWFKEPLGHGKLLGIALVLVGVVLVLGFEPQAPEVSR
jgi:multidrug transporter EmrE-like cation transporter